MDMREITVNTKKMIDDIKTICANYGLGNASSEYKIITEVFLYKFLNDKFIHEAKEINSDYEKLNKDDYEILLMELNPGTARFSKKQTLTYLYNNRNKEDFYRLFDDTLNDLADTNIKIFSVSAGGGQKIRLFESISQYIIQSDKKTPFCRAVIDKLIQFSFEEVFNQKYDFFAQVFEYLVKDYNKDFGKYAEYYTPHTIASIIARIMVPENVKNVTLYDPAAGSGTLLLALAHQIGENKCTLYSQDISQKSNEFLRLNLILNNLVHSLGHVVHDDTLLNPRHLNEKKDGLRQFDYIVCNPPFGVDFSDNRDTLASENYKERFFAGVPKVPPKEKDKMSIYLMFIQHILYSMSEKGKAAIIVPTGFLTAKSGIELNVRQFLVDHNMLRGVISMPSNIFATTGTNVSILFIGKTLSGKRNDKSVVFMDASNLGTKEKIDNKNQKTVLSYEEVEKIIENFSNKKSTDGFSISVSSEEIKQKNYSFGAGQYFEVNSGYIDISVKEFEQKLSNYKNNLVVYFKEGKKLENEILKELENLKYDI
ncbi:HsdM family class I SAM-dependent methyltransferase [Treponema primitia]|uniref:HsdM family class I SAM-dependent methyltransferase n=1 Tax=Treponema primitia TaxID=88058 RepID=UPI00025550A8|nr:class I SAM-dependent DNA methyltransferase [Treponema primitia]